MFRPRSRSHRSPNAARALATLLGGGALVTALVLSWLLAPGVAEAHNLQTRMVYMYLDPPSQALLKDRISDPLWSPPDPLLQAGDMLGLIIKVVPRDGTTTGVGGHVDFYVPDGVQVLDAAYVVPDGMGGYTPVGMKGQSPIAIGSGPIGAKTTPELIGLGARGPNINGVTENPVVPASGLHRGTIAGVYGDTGIFYSTDPDTAYGSWQSFTGDPTGVCGSRAIYPTAPGKTITNNSGDVVVPCNKWDAEQLFGFGATGTTYASAGLRGGSTAIVDYPDQRGNSPWGFASGVAGPQSGYAWNFDWDAYKAAGGNPTNPAHIQAGMTNASVGPWKRIQYPGSRISKDQAGLVSTTLGFTSVDGGSVGSTLPLASTTSQTDATSPKTIRWAIGQLTAFRPEFVYVKIKVNDIHDIVNPSGCPVFKGDTFGGDAGGTDNGKDHLWRYYEPTEVIWNGCLATGKPATRDIVKVGDTFQYKLKAFNFQGFVLTNVVVRDTLPSGVTFLGAVPSQTSGPNPLLWNVGVLQPGEMWEATVTVKATGSGYLDNCVTTSSSQLPDQTACETTASGTLPYLVPSKSVSPASVPPGGTVMYTVKVDNLGTGPTASPVTIQEALPPGFTFLGPTFTAVVNGAVVPGATVNVADPNKPLFTIPASIAAGKSLVLTFNAQVSATATAGNYCNTFTLTQGGIPITSGSEGCVDVGGGAIGDTIWRDWDGDGVQDADEEGLAGVVLELQDGVCTPNVNCSQVTTNANGFYQFIGLVAGSYTVKVLSGVPAGFIQTGDPDQPGIVCSTCDGQSTVTLATNEKKLDRDFGYHPAGTGSIGDKVFDDNNNDGVFDGTDAGIPNVTVRLYEDTNGNGVIDVGTDALVATTTTNGTGDYSFPGLATGLKYIADVDQTDPDINSYFVTTYGNSTNVVQTTPDPHDVGTLAGAYTAADFGFYHVEPGSIGDDVFIDADRDGVRDGGEVGLADVTVRLYLDTNGDGDLDIGEPLLDSTTTDGNGKYSFAGLPAGNYIVDVLQSDPDIPDNLLVAKDPIATSLTPGQQRTDIDFPFWQAMTKSVDKIYVNPGGNVGARTVTYQIIPRVPGPTLLAGAVVNDTIPVGTTFVAGSVNAGGAGVDSDENGIIDTVTWELGANSFGASGYKGGTPPPACQTSIAVEAVDDTDIDLNNPTTNNGGDNRLRTQPAPATDLRHALIHFNLPALPVGATLDSATLQVEVVGARTNHVDEVHRLITAWTAAGATWNDADGAGPGDWATAGVFGASDFDAASLGPITPSTVGVKTLAITGQVLNWYNGTQTNNGLVLRSTGTDTGEAQYYSVNEGTASRRPQLILVYTPNGCNNITVVRDTGANEVPDTDIDENNPGTWTGSDNRLKLQPAPNTDNRNALVKFSLTSIPAGASINSAILRLEVATKKNNHFDQVHRMITPWTEGTSATNGATWNDPDGTGGGIDWASAGGVFGSSDYDAALIGTIVPNTTGGKTLNLLNPTLGWRSGSLPNEGLALIATGTDTGEAQYYSSEEGTATRRPTLTVGWSIPPSNPTGTNSLSTSAMVLQAGDTFVLTQVLTDSSGVPTTNVAPSAVAVTGANGATASCLGPVPASQTVPANGSATYTRTCTITGVGTVPGTVTFAVSASNGTTVWSAGTSNGVIVSPILQFQALVSNPPGVDIVTNTATLEDANIPNIDSNPAYTALTSSIGDRVWIDSNADGIQDGGEGNVPGARVFLDGDSDGVYDVGEPFDITDENGLYHITGLANGTYTVLLDTTTLPAGYYPTTPTTLSRAITLAGQQVVDADFGVATGLGQVGDLVWIDANEDGVFDAGETPLPGVTLRLYNDVNNNGIVDGGDILLGNDTTDANGNYLFDGLYTAVNGNPVNLLVDVVSGLPAGLELVAGGTDPRDVTLSNGTPVVLTADFPYNYSGKIGDFAWYDKDGDQVQDGPAEPACVDSGTNECGALAVTIVLYLDVNNNNAVDPGDTVYAVTVTDGNGAYLFDNLPPGNYVVKADEQQVPAPASSAHAGEIGRMVATTGSSIAVDLTAPGGMTNLTADFGFIEAAEVAGHVFWDKNHNGIFDTGDTPIPNVTVTLVGTDENGNPVSLTTTTDANGEYEFIVPPGTYTVSYNTTDPDIPAGLTDHTTGDSYTISPIAGAEITDVDFGRDNSGKLGDRVWLDTDGDGTQDAGEPGLASVTVSLYLDLDGNPATTGDQTFLDSQATDGLGNYQFLGLADTTAAQQYVVKVNPATVPAGYTATGEGDPGVACGGGCDNQIASPLVGGGTVTNVDFGYKPPATSFSVDGTVWEDNGAGGGGVAGDGIQNGTEPGIGGVTVCLYDSTGTIVIQCDVTDSNGGYSFPGVPNGSYVVKTDPDTLPSDAFVQTGDPDSACPAAGCDSSTPVTVSGGNVSGVDFGYEERLGSISGTVVAGDGDGLAEGGEPAQDGVTVILTGSGPDGIYGTPDDTVTSTVTDGSGNYSFPDLPPGDYVITTLPPDGKTPLADADGANPNSIGVSLGVDENVVDQDFEVAVNVGDLVWLDTDGDGVHDTGEPGLGNVDLILWNVGPDGMPGGGDDFLAAMTTTDADGHYLFEAVPIGSYYIDVTDGDIPAGLTASPGTIEGAVAGAVFPVTGTADVLDQDFGYTGPAGTAVLGDFVWSDDDSDGIQDPGEPGLAGVTLVLKGAGPDGVLGTGDDTTVATVVTDATGHYLFTGIPAGEYLVDVTAGVPGGYTLTSGPQARPDPSQPISVAAGDVVLDVDFGYHSDATFSVEDRLWYDLDADGTPDPGEPGVPGVTIDLVDSGGNIIATTTTDENGNFSFDGLPNGSYTIEVSDVDNVLGGFGGTTISAINEELPVTVAGADQSGEHFGYARPGVIGDRIWSDADGDGVQDANELGIAGVTVQLYTDPNGDGNPADGVLVASQVTDASGHYLFAGLPAGNYVVQVTPPAGYTQTGDPDEAGTCVTCNHRGSSTLPFASSGDLSQDFGYSNPALADISGSVWNDLDKDGTDDGAGEPPLGGVTVDLVDSNGQVIASTETDANGNYSFPDVPPGDYTVVVTDENGVLTDYTLTSGLDQLPVTVVDTDITDVDVGYVRDPETGSIGDTVWLDANRDGIQQAAEGLLGGVEVKLYDAGPDGVIGGGDDFVAATTVTDPNGHYVFENLPAGNYYTAVTPGTLPNAGAGLDETTGGNDNLSGLVNLSEGEAYDKADLGYAPEPGTSALGDKVWYDTDGDGIQDPGEVGVGGVTITVTGPGCADCIVVTDPDGSWLLPGLTPGGEYTVTITPPPNYTLTNGEATRVYTMPTTPEEDLLYADFGLICSACTGSVGDRIWRDTDGDGVQDGGEAGIGGVTVDLVLGGVIVATTTTAPDGSYLFVGVPPGTYTVQVSDLGGALAGLNPTGDPDQPGVPCSVCDNQQTVVVTAGGSILTADFGYAPTGSSIGNQVWHDVDGDGVYEPNGADGLPGTSDDETPMEGVPVQLWADANGNGVYDPGIDNLVRTTMTDASGKYEFQGLPPGDYLVDITPPAGWLLTDGTDGADNNSQVDMYPVSLDGTTPNNTADYGLEAGTPLSISGTTFLDEDNDGILDHPVNDLRIPGIPVYLYMDLNGDGVLDPSDPLIASQISDDYGHYLFPDLPPGNYIVAVDAVGSRLDGLFQTTQLATDAVQPVTLVATDVTDQDFGFFAPGPVQTTPVTIAYFRATRTATGTRFEWMTATEHGNVGFHLYAVTGRDVKRLNTKLVPTHRLSSMTAQRYVFEATGVTGETFLIEDVARDATTRRHGTFTLGQEYGTAVEPRLIDWAAIHAEHAAADAARKRAESAPVAAGFRAAAADNAVPAADNAAPAAELTAREPFMRLYLPFAIGAYDHGVLAATPELRLTVDRDGVYRLTYEQLLAEGFDLDGVPASLIGLTNQGEAVPVTLSTDGAFGPGQYLEFYGQAVKTRYTRTNVYYLVLDADYARRVDVVGAAAPDENATATYLETLEVDENRVYDDGAPAGDPWYNTSMLTYQSPRSWTFPLAVPDLADNEGAALTVDLWGVTDFPAGTLDHHVQIFLNDQLLADDRFDGWQRRVLTVDIPDGRLHVGANTLKVTLPGDAGVDYDMVNLDKYALRYARAFTARDGELAFTASGAALAVTNLPASNVVVYRHTAAGTVRLADLAVEADGSSWRVRFAGTVQPARYTVASAGAVRQPAITPVRETAELLGGPTDYLVIAHPGFAEGIQPLVAFHQQRGLTVKVVDVRDVYDQYTAGVFDPAAIRAYVREAKEQLGLRFVLLVGGDTYDYLDYLGTGSMSFIPTLYGDSYSDHVPVDQRFADVDADGVPDLALGRLPVRTAAELDLAVGKTLTYAAKDYGGTALFAADVADGSLSFTRDSNAFAASLTGNWSVTKAYMDELGLATARQRLLARLNQGVALTSYVGHSSASAWTFQNLFHARDVAGLTNAGRPTVVLQWGCWNTFFLAPATNSLGHELLLSGDRGAAAVLGSTTLTNAASEERLGRLVFPRLAQPGTTIGEAVLAAKIELAESGAGSSDVLMGWTLLGDPALVVAP